MRVGGCAGRLRVQSCVLSKGSLKSIPKSESSGHLSWVAETAEGPSAWATKAMPESRRGKRPSSGSACLKAVMICPSGHGTAFLRVAWKVGGRRWQVSRRRWKVRWKAMEGSASLRVALKVVGPRCQLIEGHASSRPAKPKTYLWKESEGVGGSQRESGVDLGPRVVDVRGAGDVLRDEGRRDVVGRAHGAAEPHLQWKGLEGRWKAREGRWKAREGQWKGMEELLFVRSSHSEATISHHQPPPAL